MPNVTHIPDNMIKLTLSSQIAEKSMMNAFPSKKNPTYTKPQNFIPEYLLAKLMFGLDQGNPS